MTNADRITKHILKYGENNIAIHTLPGTDYWLVAERTKATKPNWKILICDPNKTKGGKIISNKFTKEDHETLWMDLLKVRLAQKTVYKSK